VGRAENGGRGGDSYNRFDEVEGIRARISSILAPVTNGQLCCCKLCESEEILGLFRVRVNPLLGSEAHLEFKGMKLQETVVRLKRFQIEEKRRRVTQIESMVAEFSKIARELDQEVALEEQRAGIFDTSHFAYPTYARAARTRRDNLHRSSEELMSQLEDARNRLEEALADLGKTYVGDSREKALESIAEIASGPLEGQPMRLRVAQA
jgi:flagellar FliJ protein